MMKLKLTLSADLAGKMLQASRGLRDALQVPGSDVPGPNSGDTFATPLEEN